MSGIVVIGTYRPRSGKGAEFEALLRAHVPLLRSGGFLTERPGEVLRELKGDCLIEIFEWASRDAAVQAAQDPRVRDHWAKMQSAAEFLPLNTLAEANKPFCHFEALPA